MSILGVYNWKLDVTTSCNHIYQGPHHCHCAVYSQLAPITWSFSVCKGGSCLGKFVYAYFNGQKRSQNVFFF